MKKYKLGDFSLEEKLALLTGYAHGMQTNGLEGKVPALWLSDGPNGLRYLDTSTGVMVTRESVAYPTGEVMANSWSEETVRKVGEAIADECVQNDVAVLLAPGVNIKRTPLCGRNFEYYSEDPYLSGRMGKAFIEGVQSKGVGTSLKHFCANNREYDRMAQSSEVDDRTLHEIYYRPFEIALEAKPWTVMCAYNPVNGVYASENKKLLCSVLREEYGFEGAVVSDWGAVHNRAKALKAGCDLEMPYNANCVSELKAALEAGHITTEDIDAAVTNMLELCEKYEETAHLRKRTLSDEQRADIARECAEEGIVLLKNDGILPLENAGKIAVIGDRAACPTIGGGGSSKVKTHNPIPNLKDELAKNLDKAELWHESGHYYSEGVMFFFKVKTALEKALWADTAVVVVSNTDLIESEAYDRTTLKLSPVAEDLILHTARANPNTVVVVEAGSAVDVSAWCDSVRAIVFAGFGGEGINQALAKVLSGKVNPSGKLAETFPVALEDTPTGEKRGNGFSERYSEGVFVGYRYYEHENIPVRYPFGHGLSYSQFEYSDLEIIKTGEAEVKVRYKIKNVSGVDGKEVSQVYVGDVFSMVERPEKELRAYAKTLVKAGKTVTVEHLLDSRAFAYYSVPREEWLVENGRFRIFVGASSADIRLSGSVDIELDEWGQPSRH